MQNSGRILVVLSTVSVGFMPALMASCGGSNKNMGHNMSASETVSVGADSDNGTTNEVNGAAPIPHCGKRPVGKSVRAVSVRLSGEVSGDRVAPDA